ncbi:MAG: hypothetical protein CL916_05125 [Deltaproteobacteria bacterium]|nr:hypothetical protein [Deltaproteobacteria bacterium]
MSINPEQQEIEEKQKEIQDLTKQLIDTELQFAKDYLRIRHFSIQLSREIIPMYTRLERWQQRIKTSNEQMEKLRDIRVQQQSITHELISSSFMKPKISVYPTIHEESLPTEELFTTYHSLLIRFHPDVETDSEKRQERIARMSKINQAYVQQDLEKLCSLRQEEDIPVTQEADNLVRLVRKIAKLRSVIKSAEKRKNEQSKSPLGTLMNTLQWTSSTDVFENTKEMLEEIIDQQKFLWLNQQMRSAQLLTEVDP